MKFTIAQIGENRLKRVLVDDRENNPQRLCEVLRSDFLGVSKCYMDEPEIEIEALQSDDGVVFNVKISAKRIKSIGVLNV